jgi:hypothetical protein
MLLIALIFSLLCRQSSCYLQQPICSGLTFGKCSIRNYCGITDTGAYNCLPCPAGNLCPGDGYIYREQQLNNKELNSKLAKYNITHTSNNSYIVSSDPSNGRFLRKKFKRFIKIVKVGLKVAAIAKTGGTAGLAKLAAAKAKQLAIKKGLQCLKNGLSNFCNGKKKGAKLKAKPRLGSAGRLVKKTKLPAVTQGNLRKKKLIRRVATPTTPVTKPQPSKPSGTRTKSRKTKPLGKGKGNGRQPSRGVKNLRSKPPSSNDDSSKAQVPCSNIFDNIANKVNNFTSNVVKNPVNKGRDWLKKNVGGNSGNCKQTSLTRRPTNLRGQTTNPKISPTKTKAKPRPSVPVSNDDTVNPPVSNDDTTSAPNSNDDSTSIPKMNPATKSKPKPRETPKTIRPPSTDDTIVTKSRRPVRKSRIPTQIAISTDDNPTPRPSRRIVKRTKVPIRRPTRMPSQTFVVTDDGIPTPRPSRRRVRRTRGPTGSPISVSLPRPFGKRLVRTTIPTIRPTTMMPAFVLTVDPTRRLTPLPTIRPTRTPTPVPSRAPTVRPSPTPTRSPTMRPSPVPTARPSSLPTLIPSAAIADPPTMIPGISWSVFSSSPTIRSNIPPTFVPTISMFSMITQIPTLRPTSRPTVSPTLKAVTQQASPTQRPNTAPPTAQPSVQPTITPSFRPTPVPSLAPSQPVTTTLSPTTSGVGVSSINSASNGQTNKSQMIIGVGVGCLILVIIIIIACIFVSRKKQSPYQIWTAHYSGKSQEKPMDSKEDIHHFYSKSSRPSLNQNSVFTPHVSGRISSRNSQIVSPNGAQKNMQRLSFSRSPHMQNI